MIDLDAVADAISQVGVSATLRRLGTGGPVEVTVTAVVRGYRPEELIGGITQGDQQGIIADDEIEQAAWPGPPRRGDQLVWNGRTATVQACETRQVGTQVAMHVMMLRGT